MSNNYLNFIGDNNTIIQGNQVYGGRGLPLPHRCSNNVRLILINGEIYINGYQLFPKQGVWERTTKALWYDLVK